MWQSSIDWRERWSASESSSLTDKLPSPATSMSCAPDRNHRRADTSEHKQHTGHVLASQVKIIQQQHIYEETYSKEGDA